MNYTQFSSTPPFIFIILTNFVPPYIAKTLYAPKIKRVPLTREINFGNRA